MQTSRLPSLTVSKQCEKTAVNLGLATLIASELFSRLPILTASLLSTSMNLLSPFVSFNLLYSCKPSKIMFHWAVFPRLLDRQQHESTHEVLARTPRLAMGPKTWCVARNTFASLGSVLSCMTKTFQWH